MTTNDYSDRLKEAIKNYATENEYPMKKIAEILGIEQTKLSRYTTPNKEQSIRMPFDTGIHIIERLGINFDYITGNSSEWKKSEVKDADYTRYFKLTELRDKIRALPKQDQEALNFLSKSSTDKDSFSYKILKKVAAEQFNTTAEELMLTTYMYGNIIPKEPQTNTQMEEFLKKFSDNPQLFFDNEKELANFLGLNHRYQPKTDDEILKQRLTDNKLFITATFYDKRTKEYNLPTAFHIKKLGIKGTCKVVRNISGIKINNVYPAEYKDEAPVTIVSKNIVFKIDDVRVKLTDNKNTTKTTDKSDDLLITAVKETVLNKNNLKKVKSALKPGGAVKLAINPLSKDILEIIYNKFGS